MSPRILLLLAVAAAVALAFNSERLDPVALTSSAGNVPYKYGCKYRVSSVWNDIIFLIDRSSTYGDFAQLYYTMNQILEPFSVVKIGSMNMANVRTGVSFFSSGTTIAAQFGQVTKSDIAQINTFGYYNPDDKVSNIDMALVSAEQQFAKTDRPNARKVIVLMTPTSMYNSTTADRLKSRGYIINVYSLVNALAPVNRTSNIQKLASPSYYTDSIKNTVEDLQNLQATANCFCDPQRHSFTSDNVTGVPTGGCYGTASPSVSSYPSAVSICSSNFRGIVALDKSQDKTVFLNKENNGTTPYYIGLKWSDDYLVWLWEDGTMLSDGDFNLFPNNKIPTASGDNKCVYQDSNKNQWTVTACRNAMKYMCEFAPCDSTNYYCTNN